MLFLYCTVDTRRLFTKKNNKNSLHFAIEDVYRTISH